MKLPRAEFTLPIVIFAGAAALAVSEFMVAFEFTPPGGEPLRDVTAADRHNYSSLLLAIAAVGVLVLTILTGAKPAAFALAGIGGACLLLFLIIDLPDAGKLGDLSDPVRGIASARAEPQAGFWLQALGALTLAVGAGAFATLRPEQLQAWRGRLERLGRRRSGSGSGAGEAGDASGPATGGDSGTNPDGSDRGAFDGFADVSEGGGDQRRGDTPDPGAGGTRRMSTSSSRDLGPGRSASSNGPDGPASAGSGPERSRRRGLAGLRRR